MKIQIWKRKNKNKNKNYIYIRYRFSQKKAYVESLNLWEWVSPTNQNEKKHNEEIKKSYLETKRRKEDDLENKRLTVYNKSETKIYFKKVFFDLCYSNNVKSVYKLLLLCDKNINTLRLNEVVKRKYLKSLKEKWENLNEIINAKESTLIKYWESFKSTLKRAHKEGLCEYPNVDNIKSKVENYKKNYFTNKELEKLYQTEPESWKDIKKAFFFSCYTGLSIGEIYNLKWQNIKSIKKNDKKIYFYDIYNESKDSKKQNSIPSKAIDYLVKRKNKDKKIFDLPDKISNRSKAFKLWKKKSGIINNKTFHDARHTFAYKIYNETKNIYLVAEKLGHKNVEITKKYYTDMKNSLNQDIDYLEKSYNIKTRQNRKKKSIFKHGNLLSYKVKDKK